MGQQRKSILCEILEKDNFLNNLENDIKSQVNEDSKYLLNYPVVYMHIWQSSKDKEKNKWNIYIGETNDIIRRTNDHWNAAKTSNNRIKKEHWQTNAYNTNNAPKLYIIGNKLFNKSLTLDIENKLIDYCLALPSANVHNGRTNAQGDYYGSENFDSLFSSIWRKLREINKALFVSETEIEKSAIYKASPNYKLTEEQSRAKRLIIERVYEAILKNKKNQLIFVEGEAGTGKTVLTNSCFYEMLENDLIKDLKCYMLINHEEQLLVYQNIAKKLGYGESLILKPSEFLNMHSIHNQFNKNIPDKSNIADLVFVDEAHLLWDGNNQGTGMYQKRILDEIIDRSRITIIMYDKYQILRKDQFSLADYIDNKRAVSIKQHNYIEMSKQLRMKCSNETMKWIDSLSKKFEVNKLKLKKNKDEKGYEIRIFSNPKELQESITKKARNNNSKLSRIVATYDWPVPLDKKCNDDKYWCVSIGEWKMPWNEQIFKFDIDKNEKKKYKNMSWDEKDYSINEVGCYYTIQGFDLSYVGVILGPSLKYDVIKKRIFVDKNERKTPKYMKGTREMQDGIIKEFTEMISKNELRVLTTRGVNGLYIYACDDNLRKALQDCISNK